MDEGTGGARRALTKVTGGLRALDRRPGAIGAIRRLRRALPGDPGFGDPLSLAGREGAAPIARLADRVFDDEPRLSREVSLGALQVWQSVLERTGRGQGEREVTILFTDIVGFSDWALYAGDEDTLALLRATAAATEPVVVAHRGRVVKRLGDGLMAVFPAPQPALDAVWEMRDRLREVSVAGHRPVIRVALHTGRPRTIGGDFLGVDVNIAARLAQKAAAGEVLVSATALEGLDATAVSSRRKKTFLLTRVKGVPTDLAVYAISRTG